MASAPEKAQAESAAPTGDAADAAATPHTNLRTDIHTLVDDGWAHPATGYVLSGRLVSARPAPQAHSGRRRTLYRQARLLLTRGEDGTVTVRVDASEGPQQLQWQTRADSQGYWLLRSNDRRIAQGLAPGWHAIDTDPVASSSAHWLVHDPGNRYGLISDIDDTVLVSQVNDTKRLLRNSLARPPEAREAVAGTAALYRAWLQQHNPNPAASPVFYISAAPRQLTDSVRRFLHHQGFPPGALLLKEISAASDHPLRHQQAYKVQRIREVLEAFPDVRFALVGDDGESDPESYAQLQQAYGEQIVGVWIRRVHPDPKRVRHPEQQDLAELPANGPPD